MFLKQFFTYDDPLIEPSAKLEPTKDQPEGDHGQFTLVMEPCDDQPFDNHEQFKFTMEHYGNKPFNNISSQELEKIITLPDSQKLLQPKWLNENRQNADNHFGIICAQEEQNNCSTMENKVLPTQ